MELISSSEKVCCTVILCTTLLERFLSKHEFEPIPMAERFKARLWAARLLGLCVQIPPGAWTSVSCEYCVLSGKSLCEGPIPRPEEFY
jgi:hypothetical protein